MITSEQLQTLLAFEPLEPRGWFRWMHNHYAVFYGAFPGWPVPEDHVRKEWKLLADTPIPLLEQVEDKQLLLAILNRHAWLAGSNSLDSTVRACWQNMEQQARGSFLAGSSDNDPADEFWKVVLYSLPAITFSPEAFCQLACNAIKNNRQDVLAALLESGGDLEATIRRYDPAHPPYDFHEDIAFLSHRVIDMILEAALLWYSHDAARLALQHGADPNIPLWELQRSYNQKYSALGFAIEERTGNLAKVLLEYGASPGGIPYAGYGHELSLAIGKGRDDIAEQLVAGGALQEPVSEPPRNITAGGECTVIIPMPNFFGHFKEELEWAHTAIGALIPLVPVSAKQSFYSANAQGGYHYTLLDNVIGNLAQLQKYEADGLDTRLSAEEICTAVDKNAYDSLAYLLAKFGEETRDRVLAAIRERKPDFGADKLK